MARRKKTEKRELSHEDIPRNTRATARRLLGRMARQWWKLLLVAGAALLSSASFTAIPLAVGMGIDRLVDAIRAFDGSAGVVETAAGALGLPVLLVAAAALFSSLMSYVQQYIIATVGEELTLSLRQDVSAKLNRLPLRYFDGHKTGDIMSRVTNDLEKVSSVMQVGLMQLVSSVFTIALAAAAMVMLSPRLFLVVLVSLALSMTATGYVSALAQRAHGGNMAAMGALTGKVEELYAGNRVVKVFNWQAAMLEEAAPSTRPSSAPSAGPSSPTTPSTPPSACWDSLASSPPPSWAAAWPWAGLSPWALCRPFCSMSTRSPSR